MGQGGRVLEGRPAGGRPWGGWGWLWEPGLTLQLLLSPGDLMLTQGSSHHLALDDSHTYGSVWPSPHSAPSKHSAVFSVASVRCVKGTSNSK